ncbi:MAG TPA: DUF6515 family protein [Syntrophales bacterium]|nr:DUF6515 family protein [Syntrophales bacterium]
MSYIDNKGRYFMIGMMLAVLLAIMLFGFAHLASADERGFGRHEFRDSRYHHDRVYPVRGHYVDAVPRGHHVVVYGHSRYYFYGGVWYRPYGPRFVVVAPPFGLVVPFLPLYYSTIWVGGIPYYYANEVYYTQAPGGYMVVEPPKGEVKEAPVSEDRLFIYPRKGQSENQQSNDRYECHRWAVNQTHYDPTQPPGSAPEAQPGQKRAEYYRAMGACLDARGYTVK